MLLIDKVECVPKKFEMRIKLASYDTMLLESSVKQIIDAVKTTGVEIKGPVPLPTKRLLIAFPRSPHVHKPSFEHFERLTHKRLICLVNPNADVNRALRAIVIPSGVNIDKHSVRSWGKNAEKFNKQENKIHKIEIQHEQLKQKFDVYTSNNTMFQKEVVYIEKIIEVDKNPLSTLWTNFECAAKKKINFIPVPGTSFQAKLIEELYKRSLINCSDKKLLHDIRTLNNKVKHEGQKINLNQLKVKSVNDIIDKLK